MYSKINNIFVTITAQHSLDLKIYHINHHSDIPKFRQLVHNINTAIAQNQLSYGDALPSVNQLCEATKLSRDTVFKSYQLLKTQGVINSVPNKGYYIAKEVRRVFLLLDTFKAYKEVLYHAFISSLPSNYIVDVQFHHYNPTIFQKLVEDSKGQYAKYVIMPFDDIKVREVLRPIPENNLLIIDWDVFNNPKTNVIVQNFGSAFETSLNEAVAYLKKYNAIHLVYPSYTNHPEIIKTYFTSFCHTHKFNYDILLGENNFKLKPKVLYITVSERSLGYLLSECKAQHLKIGKDLGIISYNETPMKEFIGQGISVISTDFKLMGKKAAQFVLQGHQVQQTVPTTFIKRQSI